MRALALLYHDVVPRGDFSASGFSTVGADHYKLTVEQFDQHLAAIAAAVAQKPVRITDDDWQSSFIFTVDDGGSSAMHVADRLESRDWRGHFFITTNYIGSNSFLNEGEIRELALRGHVIGSHSCSHPLPMWSCTAEELFAEWSVSRRRLEDILSRPVVTASLPGGFYTLEIARAAAKAGLRILFNSEPTPAVVEVDGCRIVGRYGITQVTSAAIAAKMACGDTFTCWKQQALWNAKKLLKKVAAKPYAAVRAHMLERDQ